MRIRAPLSLPLMLAAAMLSAPSAAEDSTSTVPLATTGYTAPSAGAAQSAATADRALRADTATRADQAARADVADSLSEGATPPTPAIPTGYICGGGEPRCRNTTQLRPGVYTYSCYKSSGENTVQGVFTIRIDPSYGGRYSGCGSSIGGVGLNLRSGVLYWVKRVG